MDVFCSTIIPTINRATLSRAVDSVLSQDLPEGSFEVIVVNDSGTPLSPMAWLDSPRVVTIDTNHRERSVARNTGASVARGRYLHFLDDDDVLLPGALRALQALDAGATESVVWLYGAYRTVDNDGSLVAEFRPGLTGDIFAMLISGESIPFQVSLLRARDFFRAGGFCQDPAIIGVEDRDLGRRLAMLGTVLYTPAIVASIRIGEQGSTTNWSTIAESDRLGRERALNGLMAYAHLRRCVPSDYWRGRVARAYVASAAHNLCLRHPLVGFARATAAAGLGALHIASPSFWRGLTLRPPKAGRRRALEAHA